MTARSQQSFSRAVPAAIAEGALTPNPSVVGALADSTLTHTLMRWSGVQWRSLAPGVPLIVAVDQSWALPAGQQVSAVVPIVVDGVMILDGILVML